MSQSDSARVLTDRQEGDGPFCSVFLRRFSRRLSRAAPSWISANAVTLLALIIGLLGAAALAFGDTLVAFLTIQIFGVLSCADGEVARLRHQTSAWGDYFDTVSDRIVELAVIGAGTWYLSAHLGEGEGFFPGFFYLGGAYVLVVSQEKFRSTARTRLPKKQVDMIFAYVSAGSDIRLLLLPGIYLCADYLQRPAVAFYGVLIMGFVLYINFIVRQHMIRKLLRGENNTSPHVACL